LRDLAERPVNIAAGSLGPNTPERDLLVSRQHRILVQSPIAERMFCEPCVLVSALHLLQLPGISQAPVGEEFSYHHLLLERHAIVVAQGATCESFLIAPQSMNSISESARSEVITAFPEAAQEGYIALAAAPIPKREQQKQLVFRHLKNRKPMIATPKSIGLNKLAAS